MNKSLIIFSLVFICFASCHKASDPGNHSSDFVTLEGEVIQDFTTDVVLNQYSSLLNASLMLQNSVGKLNTTTNNANLEEARTNWRNMRAIWEQTEGFLIGPVESKDYDPNIDTWPTDYVQMDSVLASNNPLTTDDVKNLPQSLRGYHPLEYMIWGKGGSKTFADFTARQKQYMVSLIDDIRTNNVEPLYNDWFTGTDKAANSKQAFTGLTLQERKQLMKFLNSL